MTIHYGIGLKVLMRDMKQIESVARRFELDGLKRAGADIESNDALLLFPEHGSPGEDFGVFAISHY